MTTSPLIVVFTVSRTAGMKPAIWAEETSSTNPSALDVSSSTSSPSRTNENCYRMTDHPENFVVCPDSEGCPKKKSSVWVICRHHLPHLSNASCHDTKTCPNACVDVPYVIVKNERELPA
jgi:hypothetical protein